ncbi:MAG: hypothetical protein WKF55_08575 [Gemmatimonadaceae bacterium]
MTDARSTGGCQCVPILLEATHRLGHELRNALNGLLVNLEVVRAITSGAGGDVAAAEQFVAQAVEQAEASAKLAEAALGLLDLLLGAVGTNGEVKCELISSHSVRVAAAGPESERVLGRLAVLGAAAGVRTEAIDTAIILTLSARSLADTD